MSESAAQKAKKAPPERGSQTNSHAPIAVGCFTCYLLCITKKQRGVIRKDRSDVALYCGRKGFPPDIFPARHEKGACVAQGKWERYIIDLHRAESIAGGNGNPAQYNTEDNKNICEAIILT